MADKSQGERDFLNRNDSSDRSTMLKMARDSLYLTSDRLRSPQVGRKHPINLVLGDQIQEVETELSQLDLGGDSSTSSEGDAEESRSILSNLPKPRNNSTPIKHHVRRQEVRPSPERLDAQLRSLEMTQNNSMMKVLLDQNKTLVHQNRLLHDNYTHIADVIKENKDALVTLKTEIELHRNVMKNVQEVMTDVRDVMKDVQKDMKARATRKSSQQTEVESEEYEGQYMGEDNSANNTENGSEIPPTYRLAGFPAWPPNPRATLMSSYGTGGIPATGWHYPQQPVKNCHPLTYYSSMGLPLTDPSSSSLGVGPASPFGIPPIAAVGIRPMDMPPGKIKGPSSHDLPANVTITTREALPVASVVTTAAPLSVSVPVVPKSQSPASTPQSVHSYQISLPATSLTSPMRIPPATTPENSPAVPLTTSSLLSSVPPPTYSAVTPSPPKTTSAERIRRMSSSAGRRTSIDGSRDRKESACSEYEEEHDPMPDFVPIIPLPEEVEVNTGEEDEETLFCERAKLYRFVDKEWKERGLGDIKILFHPETKKARVVMRREQVLKICANHFILPTMVLDHLNNNDRTWVWSAQDYADGKCVLENFCVRFKLAESATAFKEAFEKGMKMTVVEEGKVVQKETAKDEPKNLPDQAANKPANQSGSEKLNLGGFTFNTQPKVNEPEKKPEPSVAVTKEQKPGPFAGFSFSQTPTFGIGTGIAGGSLSTSTEASNTQTPKGKDDLKTQEKAADKPKPLSELFKPKVGSWSCEGCYTRNDADKAKCMCCETPNPNAKPKPLADLFKPKTGSWECSQCLVRNDEGAVRCVCCDTVKPGASADAASSSAPKTPSFGSFAANAGSQADSTTKTPTFGSFAATSTPIDMSKPLSFGSVTPGSGTAGGFSFNTASKPAGSSIFGGSTNAASTTTTSSTGFSFANFTPSTQSSGFSFTSSNTGGFKFSSPSSTSSSLFNSVTTTAGSLDTPLAKATPGPTFGTTIVSFPNLAPTGGSIFGGSAVPVTCEPQVSSTFTVSLPKGITITPVGNKSAVEEKKPESFSLFGGSTATPPSFGSLAASQSGFTFKKDPPVTPPKEGAPFTFGTPQQKFEFSFKPKSPKSPTKTPKTPEDIKQGSHDDSNEYYEDDGEGDRIYFQPVIPLPEEVEVKTGEEDEAVLYSHRAKLFRFKDSEWKERGLGDVKILQHNVTKKIRLLMRRERVHKICLNHYLNPDIDFKPKDDKAFFWHAMDFAEGVQEEELFSIKFKTPEIAQEFKAAVDKAQESIRAGGEAKPVENDTSRRMGAFEFKTPEKPVSVFGGTQFSPVNKATHMFGSKSAEATSDDDVQVVFENSVTEEQKKKAEALQLPLKFFSYESAPPCPGCRGCRDDLYGPNVQEKPEEPKAQPQKKEEVRDAKPANSSSLTPSMSFFGDKAVSQFSFASLASDQSTSFSLPSNNEKGPNPWVHAGAQVFGGAGDGDEDGDADESAHDPHFEPIVPLPDLIDVKTGEEDCEKLFAERSKLYRYDSNTKEWKERGVGEMKILREKTGKIRILLRRDQIHKVVCNHWLTPDMSFSPHCQSDKAVSWVAMNYADEQPEGSSDMLAVRFKNESICTMFKEKIAELQKEMEKAKSERPQVLEDLEARYGNGHGVETRYGNGHRGGQDDEDDDEDDDDDEEEESGEEDSDDDYYNDYTESFKELADVSMMQPGGNWEEMGDCEVKILFTSDGSGLLQLCNDGEDIYTVPLECITSLTAGGNIATWGSINPEDETKLRHTAKFKNEGAAEILKDLFEQFQQMPPAGLGACDPELAKALNGLMEDGH